MKELFKLLKKIFRGFNPVKLVTRIIGQGIILGFIYAIGLNWIDPAPLNFWRALAYAITIYVISLHFWYLVSLAWVKSFKITDGRSLMYSLNGELLFGILYIIAITFSGDLSA
ncbi:hypothetical protein EDL99_11280 [Ornithobacterium rhinotracheale]|uniref:hypothetical protein n=1 Tax=Ornithobacterium rhinotracheale TaxID=28251 RepID=UPI00129C2077|nr:hypothetical protein [Ornithobacterium rhinotracheale]MRJ09431.1 hypothetical protein [Ornithobacterium rhinotracheale]UOH77683.1 hypothetical protein MT996_10810 [Ornithobacterium rhinotracheale]UOH78959.1 hypothetical protein MT996_05680 [Ornithobacterium rhinotracheale]